MDARVHEAIGAIYDAAVTPAKWRHALDLVAQLGGAKAMALVIRDDPTGARNRIILSSEYLDFSRTIRGMFYGAVLDRHQNADWERLAHHQPLQVVADIEGGRKAADLDKRPDYRSLSRNLGVTRRVGVRLSDDKVWFDAISLGFGQSDPIGPDTWTEATQLLPHLSRAVEISRMFFKLRRAYSAVLSALDHVDVGLAICKADGDVVVANDRAEEMFGDMSEVSRSAAGRIRLSDPRAMSDLSEALAAASSTAAQAGAVSRRVVAVPIKDAPDPLLIDVVPLRDSGAEIETGLTGALLTFVDPGRMPALRIERFVEAYGLTSAEAEVCTALIEGRSNEDIAEIRGTSPTTVKNQIASILSKTGANRRVDLMALVLRILPPIR